MTELSAAGDRIGDVVKLITTIAAQTNLLALNATIEAARAGDAGRGFAVVAQEVKNLAGQTAKATDEISSHIVNMQRVTEDSVSAIRAIGQTVERISGITTSISAAVAQQGMATQNIAEGVRAAAGGTIETADNSNASPNRPRNRLHVRLDADLGQATFGSEFTPADGGRAVPRQRARRVSRIAIRLRRASRPRPSGTDRGDRLTPVASPPLPRSSGRIRRHRRVRARPARARRASGRRRRPGCASFPA